MKKCLILIFLTATAFAQDHQGHNHEGHNHAHDHGQKKKVVMPDREIIELDPQMFHDYEGVYYWKPHRSHIKVTIEDGKLYGQPDTKPKSRLLPVDVDEFMIEGVGAELNFVRSDEGLITGMILLEDKTLEEAPKLTKEQAATCTEEKHTHNLEEPQKEKKS